jgi:flagellar biosynthesis protein FlhG
MDQASGLRNLLARNALRVWTVVGAQPGLGATSLVLNLAALMARAGQEVLILDEHLAHNNAGNALALKPRHDLLNVLRCDKALSEVLLRATPGLHVLPVARVTQAIHRLSVTERQRLLDSLVTVSRSVDVVLVDATRQEGGSVMASLAPNQPLVLVTDTTAGGITASYALIKRMALKEGLRKFSIVVNRAQEGRDARAVVDNMARVAKNHLKVQIDYLGHIPVDEQMNRATQLRSCVVAASPGAPASSALADLERAMMQLPSPGQGEDWGLPSMIKRLIGQQTRPPNWAYST